MHSPNVATRILVLSCLLSSACTTDTEMLYRIEVHDAEEALLVGMHVEGVVVRVDIPYAYFMGESLNSKLGDLGYTPQLRSRSDITYRIARVPPKANLAPRDGIDVHVLRSTADSMIVVATTKVLDSLKAEGHAIELLNAHPPPRVISISVGSASQVRDIAAHDISVHGFTKHEGDSTTVHGTAFDGAISRLSTKGYDIRLQELR